jgi:predicted metal-dependent hydrolase
MSRRQTFTIDDTALDVRIERKRVKHVNARLHEQTMTVSAPLHMPDTELDPIIVDLGRRLLRRVHARRINADEDALALARRVAARFPRPPQVVQALFVKTQESRWGSYSAATGTIRLNAALRSMPRWVLESVVAHELAHVTYLDHSPAFWTLLRRVCPETDRARAFLAGVSWLGHHLETLPPVERALLMRADGCEADLDA